MDHATALVSDVHNTSLPATGRTRSRPVAHGRAALCAAQTSAVGGAGRALGPPSDSPLNRERQSQWITQPHWCRTCTTRPYQPLVEHDQDQWHPVGLRCARPKLLRRASRHRTPRAGVVMRQSQFLRHAVGDHKRIQRGFSHAIGDLVQHRRDAHPALQQR